MSAKVIRGLLGWGNRKTGLEAYGPGGRWSSNGLGTDDGDLLGDALEREGLTEGAVLFVVAVPRSDQPHGDQEAHERLMQRIHQTVDAAANQYLHRGGDTMSDPTPDDPDALRAHLIIQRMRLAEAERHLAEARRALARVAACPNPNSVDDCHNRMSDIALAFLAAIEGGSS